MSSSPKPHHTWVRDGGRDGDHFEQLGRMLGRLMWRKAGREPPPELRGQVDTA